MSQVKKRTFSLPQGLSDFIDGKVEAGNYASSSEVVRAGLRALMKQDTSKKNTAYSSPETSEQKKPRKLHPIEDVFDEIRARRGTS